MSYNWYVDSDYDDEQLSLDINEATNETITPQISWQAAYEANKTRASCVLCGKKTVRTAVFSTVINTCECVDALAKAWHK